MNWSQIAFASSFELSHFISSEYAAEGESIIMNQSKVAAMIQAPMGLYLLVYGRSNTSKLIEVLLGG